MEKVLKTEQEWREQLAPDQYAVLRQAATEPPHMGQVRPHQGRRRLHVRRRAATSCSTRETKFDSGSGWPSFTDPKNTENVELRTDTSHGMVRTEVVCARCGGHLGHVFDDGPGASGQRFCINSCALDLEQR